MDQRSSAVPAALPSALPAAAAAAPTLTRPVTVVASPADVRAATQLLAERFIGGHAGSGRYVVDLGHAGFVTLDITQRACIVRTDTTRGRGATKVTLRTDASTWSSIARGELDGIRAFLDGRLAIDGDLHAAVRLTSMFAPVGHGHAAIRSLRTRTSASVEIASLAAGQGSPVVLIHGLGANLLTFLPTFTALAERHEVHVIDLPGFGRSSKPAPRGMRYHPSWMARHVKRYLLEHDLGGAHLVGNSMGGRISVELALQDPSVVGSVTGLCPAVAFDQYQPLRPLLRTTMAHWGAAMPLRLPLAAAERALEELFVDPGVVPAHTLRAVAADAVEMAKDRGFRLATAAATRHLGAEPATGRNAYWTRLAGLDVPSLWIFGRQDVLVHPRYAQRVRAVLPRAQVEVWDGLGHVPQFERPDETHAAIGTFVGRLDRADRALRQVGYR